MTPKISIAFTAEAQAILARYRALPKTMLVSIARAMDFCNQHTLGVIQQDFLNFPAKGPTQPDGLRHQTGNLFKSVDASKSVIMGNSVTSTLGSNVRYAAVHEYGGTFTMPARKGVVRLRTDSRGDLLRQGKNGKLAIFARKRHKRARVVSFEGQPYEVTYPARAPFQHGLAKNLDLYRERISTAVVTAATGGPA